MIRAKFTVLRHDISQWRANQSRTKIILAPVVSSDPESENGKFYAATPGGEMVLDGCKAEVIEQMQPGMTFYVDFTPAD